MRAIDLTCLLAAPLLVGVLMTYCGPRTAVMLLSGYAVMAWAPEVLLLRTAISHSVNLRAPKPPTSSAAASREGKQSWGKRFAQSCTSWAIYAKQSVLLANVALALLYMTVLSLGFLMTSYLTWTGLTEAEVSVYRGIGAITGLLSTAIFPFLSRKAGETLTIAGICCSADIGKRRMLSSSIPSAYKCIVILTLACYG